MDFGDAKSPQKGYPGRPQLLRHTSLRARVSAEPAEQDKLGLLGSFKCLEGGLSEKPCAQQSAGPGSSALEQWLESYLTEVC